MRTDGQHIIVERLQFLDEFSAALGCVNMEQYVFLRKRLSDFVNWLNNAGFVIDVHHTYKQCILSDSA